MRSHYDLKKTTADATKRPPPFNQPTILNQCCRIFLRDHELAQVATTTTKSLRLHEIQQSEYQERLLHENDDDFLEWGAHAIYRARTLDEHGDSFE